MEKQKLLKNLRHRLSLLLCLMAFLTVGQSAWAGYGLKGSSCFGLDSGNETPMVQSDNIYTYSFKASCGGNQWLQFYYNNSSNSILCKVNDNSQGVNIGTEYSFNENNGAQFNVNGLVSGTSYTITVNANTKKFTVTLGSPTPGTCTYWMKHPWNGGEWTYKELTSDGEGGYTITDLYGSGGCNINKKNSGTGEVWFEPSKITVDGDPSSGDECIFRYEPGTDNCDVKNYNDGGRVTITKKVTAPWTLRGEITGGFSNPVTFEGSDVEKSCTLPLTAQVFPQGQASRGFKIVKNDGSDTWYGAKTTMTRENNTATFQTGSGDEWNCGLNADITGNYTFTITNLTGNPELTITYPSQTYSIARWGAAPTIDGLKNIDASAYVATHGCSGSTDYNVTQLKVRYWKEGEEGKSEVIESEERTESPYYTSGQLYDIEIPYTSNVLMNCTTESKIIMEVACKNGLGWSAYSDRMAVMYTAGTTFVTENLTKSFTACEGNHQFTLSEMVKPVPDSWTVTSGGANSDFTLVDGEMIWNPGDKTTGQYVYNFTFKKAGYEVDGTATLTINYTKTAPTGTFTISASKTAATKYEEVTLTATEGTGVEKIKWLVTPDTYITTTNSDGTNAKFQGKAIKTYTVTAVGLSASCGETAASNSVTINVSKDTEDCHE